MVFAKLAFSNKLGKSNDFRDILGSQNHWKSVKSACKHAIEMLFGFSLRFGDFLHILTSKMHLQNHQNIDFGSFLRRFGIDLMLQARIWLDFGRPGLDFS